MGTNTISSVTPNPSADYSDGKSKFSGFSGDLIPEPIIPKAKGKKPLDNKGDKPLENSGNKPKAIVKGSNGSLTGTYEPLRKKHIRFDSEEEERRLKARRSSALSAPYNIPAFTPEAGSTVVISELLNIQQEKKGRCINMLQPSFSQMSQSDEKMLQQLDVPEIKLSEQILALKKHSEETVSLKKYNLLLIKYEMLLCENEALRKNLGKPKSLSPPKNSAPVKEKVVNKEILKGDWIPAIKPLKTPKAKPIVNTIGKPEKGKNTPGVKAKIEKPTPPKPKESVVKSKNTKKPSRRLTKEQITLVLDGKVPYKVSRYVCTYFSGVKLIRVGLLKQALISSGVPSRAIGNIEFLDGGMAEFIVRDDVVDKVTRILTANPAVERQADYVPFDFGGGEKALRKGLEGLKRRTGFFKTLPISDARRRFSDVLGRIQLEGLKESLPKILPLEKLAKQDVLSQSI